MNYCKETETFRKTHLDVRVIDLVKKIIKDYKLPKDSTQELLDNLDELNEVLFEEAWADEELGWE
tara:strand:+ start:249 stop:443 length:195 start_codon:yes stop_codon:yes gene_type:complete